MFIRAFVIYEYVPGNFNNSVIELKQLALLQLPDTTFLVSSYFFIFYLKKRWFFPKIVQDQNYSWLSIRLKNSQPLQWLKPYFVQKLNTWKSPVATRDSHTCWRKDLRILQLCHWYINWFGKIEIIWIFSMLKWNESITISREFQTLHSPRTSNRLGRTGFSWFMSANHLVLLQWNKWLGNSEWK